MSRDTPTSAGSIALGAALLLTSLGGATAAAEESDTLSYPIVDTDQTWCFDDDSVIRCGKSYAGQDAQYEGLQPAYRDNGDGTITDLSTGLMWIADPGEKMLYADALKTLEDYEFAGYDDWRLPTIKELYSLSLWSGIDVSGAASSDVDGLEPFIDDDVFSFLYGDESGGARVIDSQWLTSTVYESTVMNGQRCFFGFNFADGRIKCYPIERVGGSGGYFALFARGGTDYGVNEFVENRDGTVTDLATGLTWTQSDTGVGLDWESALAYCESLSLAGIDDWRLPNIKELHSIVDYGRSPDTTNSPAVDPIFDLTEITNEASERDWGNYWSSTTLISYGGGVAEATYISLGRALGYMGQWLDVHGAGAQRSDPKVRGESGVSHRGPQGDVTRSENHVLCVSGGGVTASAGSDPATLIIPSGPIAPLEEAGGVGRSGPSTPGQDPRAGAVSRAGSPGKPGPLADAAEKLGVTELELVTALGAPGSGPIDFEAAAKKLGVSEKKLRRVLPKPPDKAP